MLQGMGVLMGLGRCYYIQMLRKCFWYVNSIVQKKQNTTNTDRCLENSDSPNMPRIIKEGIQKSASWENMNTRQGVCTS